MPTLDKLKCARIYAIDFDNGMTYIGQSNPLSINFTYLEEVVSVSTAGVVNSLPEGECIETYLLRLYNKKRAEHPQQERFVPVESVDKHGIMAYDLGPMNN